VLFSAFTAGRPWGGAPAAALRRAANRFRARVERTIALAEAQGLDTASAPHDVLDGLWCEAKADLRAGGTDG
jgi:hypothetical protein